MDSPPEFFRQAVKEFKAADALLSSQLKLHQDTAAAKQVEIIQKSTAADQATVGYMQAIEKMDLPAGSYPDIRISPLIDSDVAALKNLSANVKAHRDDLDEINHQIETLKVQLEAALSKEKSNRTKRIVTRAVIAVAAVCVMIALHFWLLEKTTLSFTVLVDGKPATADKTPGVLLDGKPFASGDKIKLGGHHLAVGLADFTPVEKEFWAFYGAKNFGTLALESFKGTVNLFSTPPDAEFQLSGNGQHWQGALPFRIENVPVATYQLAVRRKGWEFNSQLAVSKGSVISNGTEFPYGSIEVSSDPVGLVISTNGVEIGKTPIILSELKPGQYTLTASDGENDLMADVAVAPKQAATHTFVFHYSTVQLASIPIGATVIRNGKEIGKTPLTLNHVPAGDLTVDLRLQDYVSTNLSIHAVEGVATSASAKLISERYLEAMTQAREAFDNAQYAESKTFLVTALESEPNDPAATVLQDEVSKALVKEEQDRREAKRLAEIAQREAGQKEIFAIIKKAIAAVGGRDVINKFKTTKMVSRITGQSDGANFSLQSTLYIQLPDKIRLDQIIQNTPKKMSLFGVSVGTVDANAGSPSQSTFCVTPNGCWEIAPGILGRPVQISSVGKAVQSHLRTSLYIKECMSLVPLLGADYTLEKAPVTSRTLANSIGIRVSKNDLPFVTLYFDKDSGLLAGLEADDTDNQGKYVHYLERYSDYQNFSGLMFPKSIKFNQNANTFSFENVLSFEPLVQTYGDVFSEPPRQQ